MSSLAARYDRYTESRRPRGPGSPRRAANVKANHTGLLEEALEGRDVVPAAQAHRAVNNLHDLKHSFDQYNDNIILYYSDVSNYIPRLKVDYFSL